MIKRSPGNRKKHDALDELIQEITVDAHNEDEQIWAFQQVFEDTVALPADGFIIGEPVSVISIDYDGNERRGVTARCRRENGAEYVVALPDVVFPKTLPEARLVAAYRKWLGLKPYEAVPTKHSSTGKIQKTTTIDINPGKPVELVVLAVAETTARCRLPKSAQIITLRISSVTEIVPGSVIMVMPRKQWNYVGHPYLSGDILLTHIDVKALDLVPLGLQEVGIWNPLEDGWQKHPKTIEKWAKPIIAFGPRPMFEMEQVLPGDTPEDSFDDPITRSNDLRNAGKRREGIEILMKLAEADLRCLNAHAHLGNMVFDLSPRIALLHYEVGFRIGRLSLGDDFVGVLPWEFIDNRPFLRCMHGYGLCLWRLERYGEAEEIFQQMLWLDPDDNQGARFLLSPVRTKTNWNDFEAE
jgi:hypothetical protein